MTALGAGPSPAQPQAAAPSPAARLLEAVAAEAGRRGRADLQARLARERGRLATPEALVVVVGEFKKGKGTLVNALLGARVCGVDPVSTTLVPTAVGFAPHPTAVLLPAAGAARGSLDGHNGPVRGTSDVWAQPVDAAQLDALHDLVQGVPTTAPRTPAPAADISVAGAEVGLPRQLLAQGLTLLDTPGLNGGLGDGAGAATLRAASGADAVLFVSDASQELTAPELELIRRLARQGPAVLLAITKIDVYPAWRRIVETDRAHLRRAGLDPAIFPLAAPLRHRGLRSDRPDLDAESGYPPLAAHLRDEIVGRRRARLERVAAVAATDALHQLLTELETERAALADPAGGRELKASLDDAERGAKRMDEAAASWRRELADRSQDMTARCNEDLKTRMRALEVAAEARIRASDPAREWDDLRRWLFGQTNDALLTHQLVIRSEGEALVAAVTSAFETASEHIQALLEAAADRPLTAVDDARSPEFIQLTGIDLIMQGARGGGVGMVIVSAVGALTGIAGIAASAMLAPVGIGVLVVLGRRTIASVRDSERRTHQANALRAAQEYLAQARQVGAQDSAITREQLYRGLRDTLTELAAELATSAQRNLKASARAIAATHESRRARLATVEAEIARLQAAVDAVAVPGPGPDARPAR
ncbi:dynamin family protein [Frankia gtarii]|uniref:dynamin family protein n=1 Tax=Frankia gtarii TaxID=2950102 RepID=UPI0021C09A93|nr:dynamin family protein [Frankia gtarii]